MPRPGRMTTDRAKDFKGTLRQLLREMGRYKISMAVVIVFAFFPPFSILRVPRCWPRPPRHWLPAG